MNVLADRQVWLKDSVFIYELRGCSFEVRCSVLLLTHNFRSANEMFIGINSAQPLLVSCLLYQITHSRLFFQKSKYVVPFMQISLVTLMDANPILSISACMNRNYEKAKTSKCDFFLIGTNAKRGKYFGEK